MKKFILCLALPLTILALCSCPGAGLTSLSRGNTISGTIAATDLCSQYDFYYDKYYLGGPGTYTVTVTNDASQGMYVSVESTDDGDSLWNFVSDPTPSTRTFEIKEFATLEIAVNSGDYNVQIKNGATVNYTIKIE
jgi:hypothetical protein